MVGEARRHRLLAEVAAVYDWIDAQLRENTERAGCCKVCGACCDFGAYDHRLYVTPPELIYLAAHLDTKELKQMTAGCCPYQEGKRCTVHEHRFASCRIFCCNGDAAFQSELSEAVLKKLKAICAQFDLPYCYEELGHTLRRFTDDTCQSAEAPYPADRED